MEAITAKDYVLTLSIHVQNREAKHETAWMTIEAYMKGITCFTNILFLTDPMLILRLAKSRCLV